MNGRGGYLIRAAREEEIRSIVGIHLDVLGYTLNSQLGLRHLQSLYRTMIRDSTSFVGVALLNDLPVGAISGTTNASRLRSALLAMLPLEQLASIAYKMLLHPQHILDWWRGMLVAAPVDFKSEHVVAELTAIVVDPTYERRGIGRALLDALEDFFRQAHVYQYRLDTRIENTGAADFYTNLGFHEICRRADSIVYVRSLD